MSKIKARKRLKAIQILDRCNMATVRPPEWVRHLFYGPKKKGK